MFNTGTHMHTYSTCAIITIIIFIQYKHIYNFSEVKNENCIFFYFKISFVGFGFHVYFLFRNNSFFFYSSLMRMQMLTSIYGNYLLVLPSQSWCWAWSVCPHGPPLPPHRFSKREHGDGEFTSVINIKEHMEHVGLPHNNYPLFSKVHSQAKPYIYLKFCWLLHKKAPPPSTTPAQWEEVSSNKKT